MSKSGVDNDSAVVITSKGNAVTTMAFAARLYWTLKYFGFDNMALLNGGTAQWIRDKQKLEFGKSKARESNFQVSAQRKEILAQLEDVERLTENRGEEQLLDVRSAEEYLGLTACRQLISPDVSGHVPGAKNFPINFFANSFGVADIYDKDKIQQVADLAKVNTKSPTVVMCTLGGLSSLAWFIMHEVMGNNKVRVYDGSMHEWSRRGKPVVLMKIE